VHYVDLLAGGLCCNAFANECACGDATSVTHSDRDARTHVHSGAHTHADRDCRPSHDNAGRDVYSNT